MATVVLQAAGSYLGGFLGTTAAAIGSAAGAMAGYIVDRALIEGTRKIEGPRLDTQRPFTAEEGVALPLIYGTMRVGGTIIWATRFEEERQTERQGAKGGPKVSTYSYFANVALALCDGRIAGVRRVWADGRELDLTRVTMRVHSGAQDQEPDPLIEARQSPNPVPAFKGTAYVVFERLPLDEYGNRVPQLQFEVMRPAGTNAERIRAVALIPGSTEFGLGTTLVSAEGSPGESTFLNRNILHASTDIEASLDELQGLCPNLEHVALVVSWFGDDLRAGACSIRPGVTQAAIPGISQEWRVSGIGRGAARLMSSHSGGAAYGGSPSDISVLEAIAELKNRGLKVTLYPFVMMDIPGANDLPDPYGGSAQAAYPWRGRITCMPAPGLPGAADRTATARTQIAAFCGAAEAGDFREEHHGIGYAGPAGDWGYRRLILHYAKLAAKAGGVEAFLVGSELRGLTTLRDETDAFPFVEALVTLAAETKAILGPSTTVTYGADWSEYFGYQPSDGSGDVYFHLDPLWASEAVGAVGIDNYMPLSDWRDSDYGGENPDGFRSPYDPDGLCGMIAAGEGFDWYYASGADRVARVRTPITDGAYSKPWIFRYKDLEGWWGNTHFERVGGFEKPTSTAWVPRSKPIWMTEIGCSAADKGPNQPNVFPDPKSSENALPYFSDGGRSDLAMIRYIAAHLDRWDPDASGFEEPWNPWSDIYDGRMVDPGRLYLWAWDARPFPAFPSRTGLWKDGANWLQGHWLNGRLSGATAAGTIEAVLADHGQAVAVTRHADGFCAGYAIPTRQRRGQLWSRWSRSSISRFARKRRD